ncbi:hypothetical protein UT300012_36430 [Paraclostridium bifermentans]|uniref:hypothetical protein n=1 Tax=Paraclostridium bifermentans TaxID=1490 RepID=UPI001C116E21|nr:hypothetical protein [Paraclostridium bifermentans]MBS5955166.1 hypothetical protein [Paraclostridium bifermentans]MBU5289700.1 hypothetical protein [Paraclostridium bifermentans]
MSLLNLVSQTDILSQISTLGAADILCQITSFTACTTAEAKIVVAAINKGMSVVAALGIVFGGGVSGILASAIRKAVMRKAGAAAITAL